jgi:site-specific recombinase XerD
LNVENGIIAMAKKLEELVRDEIRVRHYSYRTGVTYWKWIKRFILFYNKKHPSEMGEDEIQKFLSFLATERRISASSQNKALSVFVNTTQIYTYVMKRGGFAVRSPLENL